MVGDRMVGADVQDDAVALDYEVRNASDIASHDDVADLLGNEEHVRLWTYKRAAASTAALT